jgi:hypothetical protein
MLGSVRQALSNAATLNEIFSRASMFVMVLSAAVVALVLVAQATNFGPGFRSITRGRRSHRPRFPS